MSNLFRIFGVLEIVLLICEGCVPASHVLLPLGGTHLAQLGVVLGSAFFLQEIIDSLLQLFRRRRESTDERGRMSHDTSRPHDRRTNAKHADPALPQANAQPPVHRRAEPRIDGQKKVGR